VVLLATVSVALLVAGCTNDDGEVIETAVVETGEVVQTVAAPARIEPAARATVSASVAGQVAELLVEDGDEVGAGDELVRLTSASLDEQVEQAEAAVASAQEAAAAARDAGVDLSPVAPDDATSLELADPVMYRGCGQPHPRPDAGVSGPGVLLERLQDGPILQIHCGPNDIRTKGSPERWKPRSVRFPA
jgi:hypothetical protein